MRVLSNLFVILFSTCNCLPAVKHSKSFAVASPDDESMEELRATARRLTSDSSFRESVYKIIARKDAANKTQDWAMVDSYCWPLCWC